MLAAAHVLWVKLQPQQHHAAAEQSPSALQLGNAPGLAWRALGQLCLTDLPSTRRACSCQCMMKS